jgi:hypothetical protein
VRVGGDPGGTLYLSGGCLAFAESPVVPDLGSRLVNSRRLGLDQWQRAQRDSGAYGGAGDLLLRRGLLDAAEWQALLRSATLDAILALALQLARAPASTGFVPDQEPRAGSVRMDAGWAWDQARQEAVRLAGYGVGPGTRLRLSGPARSRLVFGAEATAVLGQMDGGATIRELAWRNGLALFGVLDWAVRVIQDGVCAIINPDDAGLSWAGPDPGLLRQVLAELRQLA